MIIKFSTDHEIVENIFNACSPVEPSRLTLAEVKNENCMKILETLTGVTEENVEDIFKENDVNDDGFVMKSEAMASLKGMALNRSSSKPKCKSSKTATGWYGVKVPVWDCSNGITCRNCRNCKCG